MGGGGRGGEGPRALAFARVCLNTLLARARACLYYVHQANRCSILSI